MGGTRTDRDEAQVMAMSTTQQRETPVRKPVTPQVVSPATCGCGQDLDRCSTAHCPRCGSQLGPVRVEATGFWQAA